MIGPQTNFRMPYHIYDTLVLPVRVFFRRSVYEFEFVSEKPTKEVKLVLPTKRFSILRPRIWDFKFKLESQLSH